MLRTRAAHTRCLLTPAASVVAPRLLVSAQALKSLSAAVEAAQRRIATIQNEAANPAQLKEALQALAATLG